MPPKLKIYLTRHNEIEKTLSTQPRVHFYSTDRTDNFRILGSKLFGRPIQVEKAVLE